MIKIPTRRDVPVVLGCVTTTVIKHAVFSSLGNHSLVRRGLS